MVVEFVAAFPIFAVRPVGRLEDEPLRGGWRHVLALSAVRTVFVVEVCMAVVLAPMLGAPLFRPCILESAKCAQKGSPSLVSGEPSFR